MERPTAIYEYAMCSDKYKRLGIHTERSNKEEIASD